MIGPLLFASMLLARVVKGRRYPDPAYDSGADAERLDRRPRKTSDEVSAGRRSAAMARWSRRRDDDGMPPS